MRASMCAAVWLAGVVAVTVAGCAANPDVPSRAVYSYVTPTSESAAPAEPVSVPPAPAPAEAPSAAAAAVPAAVAAPPASPRILPQHPALASIGAPESPKAARLVGKSGTEVEQLFGRPHFLRADKGAEIRQYRARACVLDVFLYQDTKSGMQRVEHAAVRSRDGVLPDEPACLRTLLEAQWLPNA